MRPHRDKSHLSIAKELQQRGYSVGDTSLAATVGFPDMPVAKNGKTIVVEIKQPEGNFSIKQLEFLSTWQGLAGFATTAADIIAMFETGQGCLTQNEKDRIAIIALHYRGMSKDKNPRIAVSRFEALMKEI